MGRTRKRTLFWQIQIALGFILLSLVSMSAPTDELQVCATCAFTTIQQAVDSAPSEATIRVAAGVYREPTIIVKKPVRIIGVDNPVIDGQNKQQLIVIFKADNVEISGFTLKDTGVSFTSELAGVRVIESKGCQIFNNYFENTTYGVYLEKSHQCHIANNRFRGQAQDESSGGNGVHIWTGSDHVIENNNISGHRDGIYLEFVKSSKLIKNEVFKNLRYGLHFMFSNSTHATENQFSNNGSGVAVMYSQDILMQNNKYLLNKGNASYGLLLKDIHSSHFIGNRFANNTVGIYMEGSNRSQFHDNDFSANGYALRIMGNCENNEFEHNNYRANSFDVTTNSSMSWNTFTSNYWSRYAGYDLNHDRVGDVPFRPVSLSSVVLESVEASFYLIGSLLFDLLDFVERALPELTPDTLKDESPLMEPWSGQSEGVTHD